MAGGGIDPDPVWRGEAGPTRVGRWQERGGDGWGLRRRWLGLRWRQDRPAAAHIGHQSAMLERPRGGGAKLAGRGSKAPAAGGARGGLLSEATDAAMAAARSQGASGGAAKLF
ncbi:hypothetical protein ZWY2020_011187 [Hordeum vulgare]|nr:hypothetical protein ZWY2020_011187 [Hordeum vulgare]